MKPLNELTDAELSECFAVEVANYEPLFAVEKGDLYYRPGGCGYTRSLHEAGRYTKEEGQRQICRGEPMRLVSIPTPPFSTSADAVLPWLEKLECLTIHRHAGQWLVQSYTGIAVGNTFARAACIALIEAKRREGK